MHICKSLVSKTRVKWAQLFAHLFIDVHCAFLQDLQISLPANQTSTFPQRSSKGLPMHAPFSLSFADFDGGQANVVRRGSIRAKKVNASAFNVLLVPQRWALVPTTFQILSAVWLQWLDLSLVGWISKYYLQEHVMQTARPYTIHLNHWNGCTYFSLTVCPY